MRRATSEFKKAVLAQDRSTFELLERSHAKRDAKAKAQADRLAAGEKERRDAARSEINAIRDRKKNHWLESGGSEAGFDSFWASEGESEAVRECMQ